ncbi:MAG TPA: 50S ribosomal protein L3 [Planctomycetota bacterium]|jgi:large subunit ribosomal protein L3|nr:50S ribosomal protein L3 [Planctomycetota bacterium]
MGVRALLGRKRGMSQLFSEKGEWVPVTVVEAGPCLVARALGERVLLAFGEVREKVVKKPQRGLFKKAGLPLRRHLREVSVEGEAPAIGAEVRAEDVFKEGDRVDVSGVTKGKGFQGTVRLHHFNRGPDTHGSMNVRQPGSIGSSTDPARVYKGKRMASHMGFDRHTAKNLRLVRIDPAKHLLYLRGAVPGPTQGLVLVRVARLPAPRRSR